jgi:hypothetical protein
MISYSSWIYARMMVLPICVVTQFIDNIPIWDSDGWFLVPSYVFIIWSLFFAMLLECNTAEGVSI